MAARERSGGRGRRVSGSVPKGQSIAFTQDSELPVRSLSEGQWKKRYAMSVPATIAAKSASSPHVTAWRVFRTPTDPK